MMQVTQERLRSDYDQLLARADRPLLFLLQRLLALPPHEITLLAEGIGDDQGILKKMLQAGPLQPSERPQDRFWPLAEWAWNRWGNTMLIRHYAEQFPDLFDRAKPKRSSGEARGND